MSRVCAHFDAPSARPPHLAPRDKQLLALLAGGLSNKEIGEQMGLVSGTVKVYLSRVFYLLGLTSRLEAALWARDHADVLRGGTQ